MKTKTSIAILLATFFLFAHHALGASGHPEQDPHHPAPKHESHPRSPETHHGFHPHWIMGFKFGMVFEVADAHGHPLLESASGGEISLEYSFHEHLAVEFITGMSGAKTNLFVPLELVLKVPFQINEHITPSISFGPMVLFSLSATESETVHHLIHHDTWSPGAIIAVGSAFWIDSHWGIELQLHSEIVSSNQQALFSFGLQTGIAYRS